MLSMSFLEVKELLRGFGIVIYTGDAISDCLLMEDELRDCHEAGLIGDADIYRSALLAIRGRLSELNKQTM